MGSRSEDSVFAPGVTAWREGLGKVRDAVRQELVARQIAAHLPLVPDGGRVGVLDVGCGQGSQAIRLARDGYEVTGVDLSEELLDEARTAGSAEPPEVRDRLRFERGDLLDLADEFLGCFDVVCCHGVVMYLPSLDEGLAAVVGAACPGGLVSVLTRNRAGIAMRAGMSGDWAAALAGFDARFYRNRLGIDKVRADEPDEVHKALHAAGAERVEWYGVRLFSDHWDNDEPPGDFEDIVSAEEEAARRDPYRTLSALTHTLAVRSTE
jgi:S-adenosylmethionine-dependent methyltransferase